MKVMLEVEILVNHAADGHPQASPEIVADKVKHILDAGFRAGLFSEQYLFASRVKAVSADGFDKEFEKEGPWISELLGTSRP